VFQLNYQHADDVTDLLLVHVGDVVLAKRILQFYPEAIHAGRQMKVPVTDQVICKARINKHDDVNIIVFLLYLTWVNDCKQINKPS